MAMDLGTLANAGDTALNVTIMVVTIIVVGGSLIAALIIGLKWKRYNQYRCVIFQKDGFGKIHMKYDDAGIFVDSKTKNKRLYLKNNNVGLDPDNIPFVPGMKGIQYIYLLQTGLKNFRFITMDFDTPKLEVTVGEEDVNWAINAYDKQKKLFSQSLLLQLLPFIALAFVSIIILIIFIYFFKEFATLKDFALVMKEAAEVLKSGDIGTTLLPGEVI